MSKLILIGLLALVIGGYFLSQSSTLEIVSVTPEVEVATSTEPAYPVEWLEEAEKAKEEVLKRKQLEAERSELLKEIEEREARILELEKELGF